MKEKEFVFDNIKGKSLFEEITNIGNKHQNTIEKLAEKAVKEIHILFEELSIKVFNVKDYGYAKSNEVIFLFGFFREELLSRLEMQLLFEDLKVRPKNLK